MIIALLNQKGGVGKTTLATHIAGELAMRGQQVVLLDADPQGSALDWTQRRAQQGLPRLFSAVGLARETLHQEAPELARRADHVVIDGPPRIAALARSALLAAERVLIPVQPSPYDLWASAEMVALIREALPSVVSGRRGQLPSATPRLMCTVAPTEEREPSPLEEAILAEGFAVPVPPLRERREDIPALARHLLRRRGHLPSGEIALHPISQEAMRRLERYPFLSANVRELDRALQQAALLAGGEVIQVDHLRLGPIASRKGRVRLALALGGGAVRGTAHIGVLKAFEEEGISVDLIVGTSAGSLVGALYAGGLDCAAMERLLGKVGWMDIAEPCWPRGGFLTSRRMRGFLERLIGPVTIEQLKIPFAAVAGDATTGQEVILREGPLADAVRASTAIPGIFRPVELDGRLLMDGVVVNNVPASVARALGADLVVAVDVTEYHFAPRPPRSLGEAVMRAFDIMARQTINASLEWADVVIRPPVGGLNSFRFKSAHEYMSRGYAAARAAMPEIKARLAEVRQRAY